MVVSVLEGFSVVNEFKILFIKWKVCLRSNFSFAIRILRTKNKK